MKTLVTALAVTAILATSAFARDTARSSDVVIVNGKVIGQDPDANIRSALMRDAYVSDY